MCVSVGIRRSRIAQDINTADKPALGKVPFFTEGDDLMAALGKGNRKIAKLAGKILVGEKDFHASAQRR